MNKIQEKMFLAMEKLKQIDIEEYPRIACELNHWSVPDCLKEFEPLGWDLFENDVKMEFISPLREYCEDVIGEKEVLRYWNVVMSKGMTDSEFEVWWDNKPELSEETIFKILSAIKEQENTHRNN